MKALHLIGGGDAGGAKTHVLSLLKELGKHMDVRMVSLRPGQFTDEGRSMGIDIEVVKTGNIVKDIKKVASIINEGGYDILHSHGAKANMIAAILRKRFGLPTVTTVHSDYRLDYLRSKFKMFTYGVINTIALRFIDNYIAISGSFREMLISRGFRAENIFILYNGISFNENMPAFTRREFSKKYSIELKEEDIVIGNLSRLDPVKRLDIFLQAAAVVLKRRPGVKFVIGGDGGQLADLERRAVALGVSESVHFLGWVDKNEFFNCIDINVLTSISESFSYAILEGTQYKKATVCSRVGGFTDLIDQGENGYLFRPGNYEELAGYLVSLASDGDLRREMGERLYRKAKEKFSLENMCSTQLDIYRKIIALHSRREKTGGKRYDVVISGYYGFGNSGDEAILSAIVNSLRLFREDIRIIVLSKNPEETRTRYNVDSVNRFDPLEIFRVVRNSKMLMYGGGNLIQDDTSTRSLLYYLSIVWLAKRMGIKVMLYANGIGPIKRNDVNKKFTKIILDRVDIITLREELSLQELHKLAISKPEIKVTADVALNAMAVDKARVENILADEGICPQNSFVGISIRDVSTLARYADWDGLESFINTIARFADFLIEEYGLKPLFIPMHNPVDLGIINTVLARMRNPGHVIKNKYGESEMLGIIKNVEMLVGMRLHSLIYAASMGVPFIGLVYQPKVEAFIKSVGQASGYAVEDVSPEGLKALFCDYWDRREEIKKALDETMGHLKEKALENARMAIALLDSRL